MNRFAPAVYLSMVFLPVVTGCLAGAHQQSVSGVGKRDVKPAPTVAVIDLNRLYAKPVDSVKVILGKPVGTHKYGQASALGWGGEWAEYKVKGCSKVLVNLQNRRILMAAVSIPEVTSDNVKETWQLLLGKVGLSAKGVTPNWKGWDKGGTVSFENIVLQGIKLGEDPEHSKLEHVGSDVVNSVIFLKEGNMLVLWAGS